MLSEKLVDCGDESFMQKYFSVFIKHLVEQFFLVAGMKMSAARSSHHIMKMTAK